MTPLALHALLTALALFVMLEAHATNDVGEAEVASEPTPVALPTSEHFLCRVCGHTLFTHEHLLPGAVLGGPRVLSVRPDAELGSRGLLHDLARSHGAGSVATALFSGGVSGGVVLGVHSDAPAFEGLQQRQVLCGRCGQPIGWRFDRDYTTAGLAAGGGLMGLNPASPASAKAAAAAAAAAVAAQNAAALATSANNAAAVAAQQQQAQLNLQAQQALLLAQQQAQQVPMAVVPYSEAEEAARLGDAQLLAAPEASSPACLTLHRGFWSFELCHRSRVHQFHREPDGTIAPDWSLGEFDDQDKVVRSRPLAPASGYYTSHFYLNGQLCHETGKGRASEVQFFCCPSAHHAVLEDVEEPSTCRYTLRVCVPALCQPLAGASAIDAAAAAAASSAAAAHAAAAAASAQAGPAAALAAANEAAAAARDAATAAAAEANLLAQQAAAAQAADAQAHFASAADARDSVPLPHGPGSSFDIGRVPAGFVAAAWHTILGDKSETVLDLERSDFATGIAQVRF